MNGCFSTNDTVFMNMALEQAKSALAHDDVPVGAVLVRNDTGEIVGVGRNTRELEHSALGHAEINAIREACIATENKFLSECTLYVTLEPCPMCAGAILSARIPRIVCGAKDAVAGAMGSVWALHSHPVDAKHTEIFFGCCENESKELLRAFFKNKRT